jgi:hypothetical protein
MGGAFELEVALSNSGRLVAFCVLGPTKFRAAGGDYRAMEETIEYTAKDWRDHGPERSIETMIIKTLSDAGVLSNEFATTFNSML